MADVSDDRWGSFWIWATIVIVLLSIAVAWMSATNRVDDDIPARAPAATGAAPDGSGAPDGPVNGTSRVAAAPLPALVARV